MERNTVTSAQYNLQESVEANPVPPSTNDEELEVNIYKAFSLTRHEVKASDLQVCHRLKKLCVLVNRKNIRNKSEGIRQLKRIGRLFMSESMCHENHQLAYKCHQLKNAGKIHSTWFWNNAVNVKLSERSSPAKIIQIIDIEKTLGIDSLDDFISNTSF